MTTAAAAITERHAGRWLIEVAFEDAKSTGIGRPGLAPAPAVERTLPFGL